jgi:sterol 3beta-glucosyltransferase
VRLTVATYGSEGDTRPFVALCRGLGDAGHDVKLFAEQSSVHIAHAHGIDVEPLAGDIKSTLPLDNPAIELSTRELIRIVKKGLRGVNDSIASWMSGITVHARTADAILYAGFACPAAQAIAQELEKPAIGLWLQPTTPTREFGSSALPPWRLPGWLNQFSYRASPEAMIRRLYGKSSEAARGNLFGNARRTRKNRDFPILYGFSRHIVAKPLDWFDSHRICGHWPLPTGDWQAPADLLEFLSGGPPPIYVGFGAASSFVRQKRLTEIVSAIGGRRALFYPGWSKITSSMLPKNVFVVGDTPHAWLFPLTSMVIHHGGAGTTHTASRAGVPSIVLPFGGDQSFWAARLASAGVAPPRVRPGKWDRRSLARMIEFAEQDLVRERAKMLGAAMAEENGVATAVEEIETVVGGSVERRNEVGESP